MTVQLNWAANFRHIYCTVRVHVLEFISFCVADKSDLLEEEEEEGDPKNTPFVNAMKLLVLLLLLSPFLSSPSGALEDAEAEEMMEKRKYHEYMAKLWLWTAKRATKTSEYTPCAACSAHKIWKRALFFSLPNF